MKNRSFIIAAFSLSLFLSCLNAQSDVPKSVQKAFEEKYPGENDPDWQKDSNGNFESHFKIDGKKFRADFSLDGYWIETERSIDKDDLPDAVKKVIKERFDDEDISEIEEVEHHQKGFFYDVEFKRKGKNKDVEIRKDGQIIN